MLAFDFMRRALLLGVVIAMVTPLIGNVIVLKRLSSVGDALAHAGLAGVAVGLCFGFDPVLGAVALSVAAGLSIEAIRRVFSRYSEIATSVVLSTAVGLAAVFSARAKSGAGFNSFLFGSIVAVSAREVAQSALLAAIVLGAFIFFYRELLFIAFDEEGAAVAGVRVKLVNIVFTVITALVVSIAARAVGALVISSLIVLPVACAMQISRSYLSNILLSVGFALVFTVAGVCLSYYGDVPPGGAITLLAVAALAVIIAVKKA